MARLLRQREDDKGTWDVLDDEGPSGARVGIVETPRAAELTRQGYVIASGDDWNAAAQRSAAQQDVARERAGVLAKSGAGSPGMVHALDDKGEPVVASLNTIRQRGWEAVTPETAAKAGEEYVRQRGQERADLLAKAGAGAPGTVHAIDDNGEPVVASLDSVLSKGWEVVTPEMAARAGEEYMARTGGNAPPGGAQRPFKRLSGDALAEAEDDVRRFLWTVAGDGAPSARVPQRRPAVAVQTVGDAGAPRAFAPLAGAAPVSALPPEVEGFLQRAAGDSVPRVARLTDSASANRPTGDEELRAAQERGELLDFLTRTGVGFDDTARIIAGVGGSARPPPSGLRERPVEDLMQRRAAAQQEEAKAHAAALRDPASAESERARGLLRTAAPGVFSDEELGRITAADLESALDVGKLRTGMNERKDAVERAKGQRQEDIGLEIVRQGQQQAFQAGEAAKQRAFQREMQKREDAAALERAKLGAQKGAPGTVPGTVIPGMEIAPGAAPTKEDATKVKTALVSRQKMAGYINELSGLHKEYGTELFGPQSERMGQLMEAIGLEAKTLGELGALTGPDKDIINRIQGSDPTSLGANLKAAVSFGNWDNTANSLAGMTKWSDDQTKAAMQVYGYQPKGGGMPSAPAAQTPAASPPKPGMVRMVDPSGVPGWVDASEVQEAEANGYKRST